jgi:hypothetical protein
MLSAEAAGLVLKTAKGLIKLTKRIDLMLAEQEAVESPLLLPLPELQMAPVPPQMRQALENLLKETRSEDPDPLGGDRAKIRSALDNDETDLFFGFMERYLPEQALGRVFNLNSDFMTALRNAFPDWADDPDLRMAAFYVSAGRDYRNKGYTWRIALTVVDVVSEFGAENMALFTRDEQIQSIAGAILKRFGEADLQTTDATGELLRAALSATLNGVLDARDAFEIGDQWVEALVGSLAEAREAVPEGERNNFLLGLLQGKGYPVLVCTVLETAADRFNDDDTEDFKDVAAGFLKEVAGIIQQKPTFEDFFEDHWGDLLRAGLKSVAQHGPSLLKGESPLLSKVLVSVASNLATRPDNKLLSSDVLYGIVDAVVAAVAANPDLVDDTIDEEWLAALVNSITSTVAETNIRSTFTKNGLESLVKDTLDTFAKRPELIINKPGLARELLQGILTSLSRVNTFAAEELASAAVSGALTTFSEHPELIRFQYAELVASFAGKIGNFVEERHLTKVQGVDILQAVTESLEKNPALFLDIETRLAGWSVDAVVKAAQSSGTGLLVGATLTNVLQEILTALAKSGLAALDNHPAETLAKQLENLLNAGLARAEKELGNRIGVSSLPSVMGGLVVAWSRGEIAEIDPEDENFQNLFEELAVRAAV